MHFVVICKDKPDPGVLAAEIQKARSV